MEPKCRDSEPEARRLVNNSGFIGPSLPASHRWQGQAGRHIYQSELPDELVTGFPLLSTDDADWSGEQRGESSRHKHSEGETGDLRQRDTRNEQPYIKAMTLVIMGSNGQSDRYW